jgi:undecaprenyl-diphosphatase
LVSLWQARGRQRGFLALAVGLPALAGLGLENLIERRLGTPRTIAGGLLAGSLLMLAADRRPQARECKEVGPDDGLWLGIAQASALLPGVSRSGATLAVARFRGFRRADSRRLAAQVGLPVIAGATMLKGLHVLRRPPGKGGRAALAVGAGASFASTWLVAPRLSRWPAGDSLTPYALYRTALALAILARMRHRA